MSLKPINSPPEKSTESEIRLFMVVRNEELRLPYLIDYYCQIGVDRFIILDNDSSDGTKEILTEHDNIHLFHTSEKYSDTNRTKWLNQMLEKYGIGYWCVIVDADELLIYPGYEQNDLRYLTKFLELEGCDAMYNLFLDIYSDKPLAQTKYNKGDDPLKVCSFFDPPENIVDSYGKKFGGMRHRVFDINPLIDKYPLVKYNPRIRIYAGNKKIKNAKISRLKGCLMHFPFTTEFIEKARRESVREAYWNKAENYKAYAKKINEIKDLKLHYTDSNRYENSKQMTELGLMTESLGYKTYNQIMNLSNHNLKKILYYLLGRGIIMQKTIHKSINNIIKTVKGLIPDPCKNIILKIMGRI